MVRSLGWAILIILLCSAELYTTYADIQPQTSKTPTLPVSTRPQSQKNNEDVEYRLTRLEVLLGEKLENVRIETRDSSRRLQALEVHSAAVHSTLESLKADLAKILQQASSTPAPATHVYQTNTMTQLPVDLDTDLKSLTSDLNVLKKNVSSLASDTRLILKSATRFFNQGILNLDQLHPSFPIHSASSTGLPKNCREVKESGQTHTGIYTIQPEHFIKPLAVFCDLKTRGGGWTVIQNRFDGSQDFYQNWQEYKTGFGNLSGEFWLGLDTIHQLTGSQANELLIELQDLDLQNKTAYYASFSVGPEREGFPLRILKGYCGDAGDSLSYHIGDKFSTKDVDQDARSDINCAHTDTCAGAWWYKDCATSNLNGMYLKEKVQGHRGIFWLSFRGNKYSLLKARMLVRSRTEVCDAF